MSKGKTLDNKIKDKNSSDEVGERDYYHFPEKDIKELSTFVNKYAHPRYWRYREICIPWG